ncbi:MAG: hypothetical protein K6E10_02950 [Eubacterium sp.]|nr:hypothetical protein [Eubacterium sp.]
MDYEIVKDSDLFFFGGRILYKDNEAILGYTGSFMEFLIKGNKASLKIRTGNNETVNEPGLRIYVDGQPYKDMVISDVEGTYEIFAGDDGEENVVRRIRIVKITEAAMSFLAFSCLNVEGELLNAKDKYNDDKRKKALFIGDSITCGYGVLGAPDSEYTIREEDVELSYAGVLTKKENLNSEWVSVSGYGMFVEYTGDPENILPRVFAYTNFFYDKETREDYSRFQPDVIILNLGTNDSGHLGDINILNGFKSRYESFLYTLRMAYKESAIVCVLGTLAPGVYKYVGEVIDKVKDQGFENIYGLELPEHDVEHDGMASGHPSPVTHEKDADRIAKFLKENKII